MSDLLKVFLCIGIYVLSVGLMWLYYHLYYGKKGKGANKPIDPVDINMGVFFPGMNTIFCICNWIFDFPIKVTVNSFLGIRKQ